MTDKHNSKIPKILHQIWIGDREPPTKLMATWKEKHPDFEYILWNETEITKRGFMPVCTKQIQDISEINGKADIFRWEILYQYGGYFVDADSFCIEPFDQCFDKDTAFAGFENEITREGLVATGTMGFIPRHPLCHDIIQWMSTSSEAQTLIATTRAWYSVGPGLITRMLNTGNYPDVTIYPSHYFLPIHFTGEFYMGHKKVYAHQEWGTGKDCYKTMNSLSLPKEFLSPKDWYSVLVTSYNTATPYIRECLESIRRQTGHFGIELVWVDDGSTAENSALLIGELEKCRQSSRFLKYIYLKNDVNMGPAKASNRGLQACSQEIVFKMDSDDLMLPHRMQSQLSFMTEREDAVICGANMQFFRMINGEKTVVRTTDHPSKITWDELYTNKPTWIMNHPTFCFRKSAILSLGGYNNKNIDVVDDYELLVRILKKYGAVYNLPDILLLYRVHPDQMREKYASQGDKTVQLQYDIIREVASS